MKTLTSTLQATQRANSGSPYVEALLADYWGYGRRARPSRVYTGAEASDPVAVALSPDGSLIRLRRETDAVTLELQVGASTDDSYENSGANFPTDQESLADANDEYVGVRFQGVTIAQGATILHAVLSFVFSGDSEPADPEGTLYADDVDDAAAFGSGANDISGRTPTMATVAVDESDLLNEDVNFVDLADVTLIVQEIVDRGTWSSGNALALIFQAGTDGARDFQVHHYDLDPTHGAKLVITYTTASPPAEAYVSRVATPGSGSTFSSWSSLDAEISALGGIALAVDSDTVYAFMVDDDLTTIVVRTSTDNGATWSSRATVTAAGLTGRHTSRPPRRVTTISCCSTRRRTGRSTPCAGTAAPGGRRQRGRTRCWR